MDPIQSSVGLEVPNVPCIPETMPPAEAASPEAPRPWSGVRQASEDGEFAESSVPARDGGLLGGAQAEWRQGELETDYALGLWTSAHHPSTGERRFEFAGTEVLATGPMNHGSQGCGDSTTPGVPDRLMGVNMRQACDAHDRSPGWGVPGTLGQRVMSNLHLGLDIVSDNPDKPIRATVIGSAYAIATSGKALYDAGKSLAMQGVEAGASAMQRVTWWFGIGS